MLIYQGWFTALYTQHLLDSQSLKFAYFQGKLSRHRGLLVHELEGALVIICGELEQALYRWGVGSVEHVQNTY